jgi:predicted deacetylase
MNQYSKKIGIITIHDVNSSDEYIQNTLEVIEGLEKLRVQYNIAIIPYYLKKFRITNDFSSTISQYIQKDKLNIALHGLHHEYRHQLDDFHTLTTRQTKIEIDKGLMIMKEANLPQPKVFIPPAWHVNRSTLEALFEMGFEVAESMNEIDLIQQQIIITTQQVMNWDMSGNSEQNKQTITQNQAIYDNIMQGFKPTIVRIALHPPHDPSGALEQQLEIIQNLKKEAGYVFRTYSDFLDEDIYGYDEWVTTMEEKGNLQTQRSLSTL